MSIKPYVYLLLCLTTCVESHDLYFDADIKTALLIIDMMETITDQDSHVPGPEELHNNLRLIVDDFYKKQLLIIDVTEPTALIHSEDGGYELQLSGASLKIVPERVLKSENFIRYEKTPRPTTISKAVEENYRESSAFSLPELDKTLKRSGIEILIISGVYTPVCIKATVISALEHGYTVILDSSLVSAMHPYALSIISKNNKFKNKESLEAFVFSSVLEEIKALVNTNNLIIVENSTDKNKDEL